MLLQSRANTIEENFSNRGSYQKLQNKPTFRANGMDQLKFEFSKDDASQSAGDASLHEDKWWALRKVRALQAWQFSSSRGQGQTIALIGLACENHHELEGNALIEESGAAIGSANARIGTCIASIAVSRQQGDIVGTAPSAQIFSTFNSDRSVGEQIQKAIFRGAGIVLVAGDGKLDKAAMEAVEAAKNKGIIVLTPAGEGDDMIDDVEGALVVTGSTEDDRMWQASNRGNAVRIAAPAQYLWGADTNGKAEISVVSGTAGAAALVAGIAALWRSYHGEANLSEMAEKSGTTVHALFDEAVRKTARCPNHWSESDFGAGIIDAEALLRLPLDQVVSLA